MIVIDIGASFAEDGNRLPLCPEILRFGDLPEIVASVEGPRRLVIGGAARPGDYHGARGVDLTAVERALSDEEIAAALTRPR